MRLQHIVSLIKGFDTVLDIGTDHGLVLKYALDNKYIKKGIASDVNHGPLLSAKDNLKNYPVNFYISNGFENVKEKFDAVVICGMGSSLISEIMEKAPLDNKVTYILGPHDKPERLRMWLAKSGFMIIDETVYYDKFYYPFIVCKRGKMELSEKDAYLGPILKTKSSSREYYKHEITRLTNLVLLVPDKRKEQLKELITWYKEL